MNTKQERIQVRIEPELKKTVETIFSKIGISSGEAIRMFYSQVKLHNGIPFNVRIPTQETVKAIEQVSGGHGEKFKSTDELFNSWDDKN